LKNRPEYVVVGKFGRPRGLSGEIYLDSLTDFPERFKRKGTFWVELDDGWMELIPDSVRGDPGRLIAKFPGFNSSEEVKRLTNKLLYIRSADLAELPDGSYFHFDLIGCRVVDIADKELGRVSAVESFPGNDVWVVDSGDGKRHLIPAVRQFIKEVVIERKLITIDPPEGIFDSADKD
jgi:16S rRNA processing protein RimM